MQFLTMKDIVTAMNATIANIHTVLIRGTASSVRRLRTSATILKDYATETEKEIIRVGVVPTDSRDEVQGHERTFCHSRDGVCRPCGKGEQIPASGTREIHALILRSR